MIIKETAIHSRVGIAIKMLSKVREVLFRNIDIILFSIMIIAKALYYGKQISPSYFNILSLSQPLIASILPLVGIAYLFNKNKRVKALFILDLLISFIIFADTAYFRYFKDIISVGAIRNGAMVGGVFSSVLTLIKFQDILYFLDLVTVFPFLKLLFKIKSVNNSLFSRFMVFLILFSFGTIMDGKYIKDLSKDQPMLLTTMSNKVYVAKILGSVNFHYIDFYNFTNNLIASNQSVSLETKEEIKSYLQDNSSKGGTVLSGTGSGKNLIVIQVEALQQFVINREINGVEITPNLNRWIGKSLYFDNYFYQVSSGNTSDAEFMSNNSLYPAESGAAYYRYAGNTLDSLPKELADKGYNTAAFHGYTESFWNRNIMYKTEGFESFYNESSFNIDEKVGMGLSDKSFLNQSLNIINNEREPYYSFLITLSSHFPYDDIENYGSFDSGEYEGTLMGNYLKGIHYADQQLGEFLDQLNIEGTLDNSILVLYGDHNAIPKEYAEQLYKFEEIKNPTDLDWSMLQKVPMFIHFPEDQNQGVNHKYSGQMDLYPTLANIFDINLKYSFGKDILNSENKDLIFRNGSVTDGKVFYVSWADTWYDIESGVIIDETEELRKKKAGALTELNYSDNILNHNLIKHEITK